MRCLKGSIYRPFEELLGRFGYPSKSVVLFSEHPKLSIKKITPLVSAVNNKQFWGEVEAADAFLTC
jgi:hypothetical protein